MIELRGIEADSPSDAEANPGNTLLIDEEEGLELKSGDEILVLIRNRPEQNREDYGVPLRITDATEAGENEFIVQYGDRIFVAQKMPEFI